MADFSKSTSKAPTERQSTDVSQKIKHKSNLRDRRGERRVNYWGEFDETEPTCGRGAGDAHV